MTPRQKRFVNEYLIDLNATQAAIRAGYSANSAHVAGPRLMAIDSISRAVEAAQDRLAIRTEISQARVLKELAIIGFLDPADLASIDAASGPRDISKLPENVRRAIVGWMWDKAGNFTLKLANKQVALDLIGKHLGMFVDRHEHSGPGGKPIAVSSTDLSKLSSEDLAALEAILSRATNTK